MTTPRDYDADPDRYRLGMRTTREHLKPGVSLYATIAGALHQEGARTVLDLGCGEGELSSAITSNQVWLAGADASAEMLATVTFPAVQADAAALPFAEAAFDAVVAVNILDHLPRPAEALIEVHRVLRPGGLLIAACISRHDSPELAHVWTPAPSPFDSEDAPEIVATVFAEVDVRPWDEPLLRLPDRQAVQDYLRARFVPARAAATAADQVDVPLWLTKRGALILGRKAATGQ
ncbi:class I SAM-dependent methyltransferase [Allokutzneria sp. A3M-2-11 16]|uniref:class I SAM-dependent methyltransferase n=1 Tax=Allokutzneria sp. A3M-2-11 16 TaxID=2962043 RepID=UPI0020B84730|nr:class I SAM-dependent methyltransferase [Allokutzneria sp. A3M-2-11 16]MCP3803441.1 class I SAM-dependent methyltransferase [Allokutzneria sp. A3M-2-11 16]